MRMYVKEFYKFMDAYAYSFAVNQLYEKFGFIYPTDKI